MTLYEDIKKGLEEAIAYNEGKLAARKTTLSDECSASFDDVLAEQLKDPELKAEYDKLEPAFVIMEAIMKARIETGLTKKELSEKTGISQAYISRLEHGTANPSIKTLQRIATALDRKLSIQFI